MEALKMDDGRLHYSYNLLMKFYYSFLILFLLLNCSSRNIQNSNAGEVDSIFAAIISHSKFKVEKSEKTRIVERLMDIEINLKERNDKDFENNFFQIGFDGRPLKNTDQYFFNKDYKYFRKQFLRNQYSDIGEYIKNKFFTTSENFINNENINIYKLVQFSKPYFSIDNSCVYVELQYREVGFYYKDGYILKKISGKWQVVKIIPIEIS